MLMTAPRYNGHRRHVRAMVGGHQRCLGRAQAVVPRAARAAVDISPVPSVHRGCSYILSFQLSTGLGLTMAGYENDRLRHIRLHEQVNELPDANYATLKFFMAHLDR